ncbi:hypothetical protein J6590_031270 [Homalodisca vitripennis]|nr:hypothetical protein J6590_031270 [Homalodisca vitripennis]
MAYTRILACSCSAPQSSSTCNHGNLSTPPRGATIKTGQYCQALQNLRRAVQNKRRAKLSCKSKILDDNARPNTANRTQKLLNPFNREVFSHLPYSYEFATNYVHLFLKNKNLDTTMGSSK